MKVSLNWLKTYLDIPLTPEELSEVLTATGLEVEGMEQIESIKGGLKGVVVGEVVACGKHPNADKLSLTRVNVGNGEALQIVCGAPNVASGQKVLVATVGTTLYPEDGEPWTIKKGKIRGEVSEGMICAEDELGLGHNHEGIIVLPADTQVGLPARDYYEVETDYVYEIGLTPNRSDATNHIGVARDIAAALRINHDHRATVTMPDVSGFKMDNNDHPIAVEVRNTEACPRYSGVTIRGLTVKESPEWLKQRLRAVDVRPINNLVDITNFVLHELGQPLHAFDLNAIANDKIVVDTLPADSTFLSLDGIERSLAAEDLMICDGQLQGMCIGGVFGGLHSGVKESTTDIFLESAHFDPQYIRRSSMRHNLRTDAAKVFEKGSDPNITVYALKRAALLMQELAGGEIASEIVDVYPKLIEPVQVEVAYANVNRLIGVDIPKAKVKAILEAMEMTITAESDTTFTVAVPTDKTDVTRPADVIEEILRIYGFNNVPVPTQIRSAIVLSPTPDPQHIRNIAGDFLAANGFFEMMALSLSQSRYYHEQLPNANKRDLVYVNNTSNVHLDIMRPDMLMGGLEAVLHNQNRQQHDIRLFEFGRTYHKGEDDYREVNHLTLFLAGRRQAESWLAASERVQLDYYTLKTYVQNLLLRFGLGNYQEAALQNEIFNVGMKYHRGEQTLVEFGKLDGQLLQRMDIKGPVYYADFNWDSVLKALRKHKIHFEEINKFPTVRRDLALVIDQSVQFAEVAAIAKKVAKKLLQEVNLFDVYRNEDQLGAGKKSYAVSFLLANPTKTFTDKEVDKIMNQLIKQYEMQLGAQIRR